jgi:hypothetical protein
MTEQVALRNDFRVGAGELERRKQPHGRESSSSWTQLGQ